MTPHLDGKVALVTGAGSGIGSAVAKRLARDGASIAVVDLSGRRARETADAIRAAGGAAIPIKADVSVNADVKSSVAEAVEGFGGLDIVVSNAGVVTWGSAVAMSEEDWDRTFAVNVRGAFLYAKHTVPELRRRGGGVLLLTSSTDGLWGNMGQLAYAASKAAIISMTRTMALDHGPHNIRVNCVCPGGTRTPPIAHLLESTDLSIEQLAAKVPYQRRLAEPEEIAAAFAYLASDEASFVSGHALVVDGAHTAGLFIEDRADP